MLPIHQKLAAAYDLARLPNKRPALQALRSILAEAPDHADALALYSLCLRSDGRLTEAQEAAKRALELEPENPQALVQMGWALYMCHRDKEAGFCADAAISADPHFSGGWWLRADWALFTGRHAKAEAAAHELLQLNPSDADAHAYLGRALLAQGAFSRAREALEEAMRLDPEHEGARKALAAALLREHHGAVSGRKERKAWATGAGRWLAVALTRYPSRWPRRVALAVAALIVVAALTQRSSEAVSASLLVALALVAWAPVAAAGGAPFHARARAILGSIALLAALLATIYAAPLGLSGPSAVAIGGLALWSTLRATLNLAAVGRSDESLAAELHPSFGIGPDASKIDAGFALMERGEGALARDVFRAVREVHDYCPDAGCGLDLSSAPERTALFPSSVSEQNWGRAPVGVQRMRVIVTVACCAGFALGAVLAVMGRPWHAILHPVLIGLGTMFAAAALDIERGRIERVLLLVTGAFVVLWPIVFLVAPELARVEGLEVGAYAILALRFLWAAGDYGARYYGDAVPDPQTGRYWPG